MDGRPVIHILAAAAAAAALLAATAAAAEVVDGRAMIITDGDTVALKKPDAAPERIRLLDIDAPETWHPRCEAELVKGLQAKARLAELVRGGPVDVRRSGKLDPYQRTLARLDTAFGDAGSILLAEGLAVHWRPGPSAWRARAKHWCQDQR